MKRFMLFILVSSLLVTLAFTQRGNISAVKASPDVNQGDLILTDNNVTTIEGRFDINGSIIVEGNASLILENAIINFTQRGHFEHNMTLRNPLNGNPRLLVCNSTISPTYSRIYLHENSTATINNSTIHHYLFPMEHSSLSISNGSYIHYLGTYDFSATTIINSSIHELTTHKHSETQVYDSQINSFVFGLRRVNCTVSRLKPDIVGYWDFTTNHSITISPLGSIPNVTLTDTEINNWGFAFEDSNATISNSTMGEVYTCRSSIVVLKSTTCNYVDATGFSILLINNSRIFQLRVYGSSNGWLLNSTYTILYTVGSAQVFTSWYLDAHVVDSIDQNVPSANVTAYYSNATLAMSQLTDANGWTKLILMEKMINATEEYPVGNYTVEATYDIYSDETTVNMTENKQITLTLEDFIIPEFPSLLILPLFMAATLLAVIVYRRKHSE